MDRSSIYNNIALAGSIISSLCGIVNLLLLYDMKIWNSFIFLITVMTFFQLIYDLSFYPSIICSPNTFCYNSSFILQIYSGVAQAIVSNEIAYIVLYTISQRKLLDVLKNKSIFMAIANIPSVLICIPYFVYVQTADPYQFYISLMGYFYIRLISIFLIVITCILTIYSARKITISKMKYEQSIESQAIWALARRLLYYPIVQVIARFGFSWFEMMYGFDFSVTAVSNLEFAVLCVIAITTPFGGVGYFIIFLVMQPNSWDFLKSRLLTGRRYNSKNVIRKQSPMSLIKENIERNEMYTTTGTRIGWTTRTPTETQTQTIQSPSPSSPPSPSPCWESRFSQEQGGDMEYSPSQYNDNRFDFNALEDEDLLYCIVNTSNNNSPSRDNSSVSSPMGEPGLELFT